MVPQPIDGDRARGADARRRVRRIDIEGIRGFKHGRGHRRLHVGALSWRRGEEMRIAVDRREVKAADGARARNSVGERVEVVAGTYRSTRP